MSKSIAVIGADEFCLGFRLAGVKRTEVTDKDGFGPRLEKLLADKEVGIIMVNGKDLAAAPPVIRRRAVDSIDPVVIQVGDAGEDDLREKVKRAIGIDLYREG